MYGIVKMDWTEVTYKETWRYGTMNADSIL